MSDDRALLEYFIKRHPADAARILEHLKIEEATSFFQDIPDDLAVALFKQLERYTSVKCLEVLGAERAAAIIAQLPLQRSSVFLRRIKKESRDHILSLLSEEVALPLRRMLRYAEDSAGALADPLVLTLPEDITVKEGLKRVQKRPEKAIYYLYIVDRNQVLTGVMTLRELMLAQGDDPLSAVMHKNIHRLGAELDLQAVYSHRGWQEYHALPVVDKDGILLGAMRYETLRRIEKETAKDRRPRHAVVASAALGELYKIGFTGLVRSATTPLKHRSEKK